MMPFKKNLPAAGSGFSDYYVPEEKFLGPRFIVRPKPKLGLVNPSQENRENFGKPKSLSVFVLYELGMMR